MNVYKYEVPMVDVFTLPLPAAAKILFFGAQGGGLFDWVLLNPGMPATERKLRLAGTGHPIEETIRRHIGSAQQGPFVWHLFEIE